MLGRERMAGQMKKYKKLLLVLSGIMAGILLILGAFLGYVSDYYQADSAALSAFEERLEGGFESYSLSDGTLVCAPQDPVSGLIFYPGGKVAHDAYLPLMQALAKKGVLCVLVKMPFNLAVFDINAAKGLQKQFAQVPCWYMGGHSLGGSMAASYLADNAEAYSGLILLGSYSTADLSGEIIRALSIYGSEDAVMNREKYEENLCNLSADFSELIIEGGNHAGFGMYGEQKGDGEATIDNEEQISVCAQAIAEFIG